MAKSSKALFTQAKFDGKNVSDIVLRLRLPIRRFLINLLALATLGNGTQIELVLFVSNHPMWPNQVKLYFNWRSLPAKMSVILC